jgi:hypothetical protein
VAQTGQFIGLRTKFGDTFADGADSHWDVGGSVRPTEELDATLPEDILLMTHFVGAECGTCKTLVEFDQTTKAWAHLNGVQCAKTRPFSIPNYKLDAWLKQQQNKYMVT